jgi:hypothetical protein
MTVCADERSGRAKRQMAASKLLAAIIEVYDDDDLDLIVCIA